MESSSGQCLLTLAGFVVEFQGRHVLARGDVAGQHILDSPMVVDDANRNFVELGIERGPVGGHFGAQGIAGGLVGLNGDLTRHALKDEMSGANTLLEPIDNLAMEFRQVVMLAVLRQLAGVL